MIEIGTKHISTTVVDHTNVASAVGSGGLDVFATPSMVALMEHAAMTAVAPFLAEGDTTVGGHIATSHLAPSPIGATITAHHKWRIFHYTQWLLSHRILSIGYHYGLYVIEMSHAYHIFSLQRAAPTLFSNIAYRKSRKQR